MGEVCKLCVLASKLTFFVAFEGKESVIVGLLYKIHFVCRLPI